MAGLTGTVIQTDERQDNDPEDDPSHYMMPDVHGGNVASLYQPLDLEEPREPMFQQFEAFGNAMTARTSAATGSYGWRGQEGSESEFIDSGEGNAAAQSSPNLVYMQARHYDPTIGRFLQADPLKMSSFTTQGLNRYIYCNNDPVNCSDPSGLMPWSDGVALLGYGLMFAAGAFLALMGPATFFTGLALMAGAVAGVLDILAANTADCSLAADLLRARNAFAAIALAALALQVAVATFVTGGVAAGLTAGWAKAAGILRATGSLGGGLATWVRFQF